MKETVVCVLTENGLQTLLDEGGSQSWVLDEKRIGKCEYVVCVQRRDSIRNAEKATAEHQTAFVIGKLGSVTRSKAPGAEKRWHLGFSEYAEIDVPNAWPGYRNPVFYTDLEHFNIDIDALKCKPMPVGERYREAGAPRRGLTLSEAKAGLAITFGINPTEIDIIIRG